MKRHLFKTSILALGFSCVTTTAVRSAMSAEVQQEASYNKTSSKVVGPVSDIPPPSISLLKACVSHYLAIRPSYVFGIKSAQDRYRALAILECKDELSELGVHARKVEMYAAHALKKMKIRPSDVKSESLSVSEKNWKDQANADFRKYIGAILPEQKRKKLSSDPERRALEILKISKDIAKKKPQLIFVKHDAPDGTTIEEPSGH